MIKDLDKAYNELLDEGIIVLDLFIYDYIMRSDYSMDLKDRDIAKGIEEIKEKYSQDYDSRGLEYYIDQFLYGSEDDEDWD